MNGTLWEEIGIKTSISKDYLDRVSQKEAQM